MGWVEYVSKTKLGVTDNTIVLLKSLHFWHKNNNHDRICYRDYNYWSDNWILFSH